MKRDEGSLDPTLTPSQAGLAPGGMADTAVAATETPTPTPASSRPDAPADRATYQLGTLLGRGGMGEVLLAKDHRFDRDVAIKRMKTSAPADDALARFWREAKIQARLDHPAIVPVHDLGFDAEGRPYFTMKRLAGVTLHDVITDRTASQQKLLRAFVDVCLAIEFAHERGVIHRDLKPANVMLGDYGEVYVLDWGIARLVDDHDTADEGATGGAEGTTQVGAVMGTPGYMSPEQRRGDPITPATDSYALGAVLFEVLTGGPLHPRNTLPEVCLTGASGSPAARAPELDVPPELDALCVEALAAEPADRPTARAIADGIQQFLDGDRDLALRRGRAVALMATAREAQASGGPERRAEAMRTAGHALSLDPDSVEAAALVSQILLEPLRTSSTPPALAERFEARDRAFAIEQAKLARVTLGSFVLFLPVMMWVGIKDWTIVGAMFGILAIAAATTTWVAQRRGLMVVTTLVANFVILLLLSRITGPFVLVPGLAVAAAISLVNFPALRPYAWVVIAVMVATFVGPLVLEATGVWASTWSTSGGVMHVQSSVLDYDSGAAIALVIAANVALIAVMGMYGRSLALVHNEAQRRIEAQAWHLAQLLPVEPPPPPKIERPPGCSILD